MTENLQALALLQAELERQFGPEWPQRLPGLLRGLEAAREMEEPKPRQRRRTSRMSPAQVEAYLARRQEEADFLGRPAAYQIGFLEGAHLVLALLGARPGSPRRQAPPRPPSQAE